jgi:hypothetical protein
MNKLKHAVLLAALLLILTLFCFCVYGAFLGPERVRAFFNSLPLAVFWIILLFALITGSMLFRRLRRVPPLLLIHAGCIFALAGSIAGSDTGHSLQKKFLGIDKFREGQMLIYKGQSEDAVFIGDDPNARKLPFEIKLNDFRVQYYKPEYLHVKTPDGQHFKFPVQVGTEFPLSAEFGSIKVVRTFDNFKLKREGGALVAVDDPQPGYNPALELQVKKPDGSIATRYVFELFPGHTPSDDGLAFTYQRTISDFISDLQVIKDGRILAEKAIEVNHPLHFGGYHFYQQSYDDQAHQYTILLVSSDTGLSLVYLGYLMLALGVFWHFWIKPVFTHLKSKSAYGT